MDAKSLPVCPDSGPGRLLLEAPILPYAAAAVAGTWLGLHGRPTPLDSVWPALLAVPALVLLTRRRLAPFAAWVLLAAAGLGAGVAARPPDLASLRADQPVVLEGTVASHPRGVPGEAWLWLHVERIEWGSRRLEGTFDVLVALPADNPSTAGLAAGPIRPAWGQSVRVTGYLKRSPQLGNGGEPAAVPWRLDLPSWRFWHSRRPAAPWQRLATTARGWADRRLAGTGSGARLRRALVVGTPDDLPESLRRGLRATGMSHLLAVSGLHVGLVAGWLWLLAMPLGRRTRLAVALVGVMGYLLLVGPRASAVRAAGMGGIVAVALCCRRPPQALNAAALWASVLALWQPSLLDDLGFRLSVTATLGLLAVGPMLAQRLAGAAESCGLRGGVVRLVCQGVGASLAAQLATLPLLAPWTALVHPAAPISNLVAVPWLTAFLGLAFASLALPWFDAWLLTALDVLAWPLGRLAETPASGWWTLPVSVATWECAVAALAAVVWVWRPVAATRLALVAVLLGIPGGDAPSTPAGWLEIVRLDVGQGDALLLRDGRHAVLVDGGGWRRGDIGARVLVPALARLGVRRLDAVILTHPDTDHCRGLVDLLSYLPVAEAGASPGWHQSCSSELLARRGLPWRPLWRGDELAVGRWRLEVLWPMAGVRRGDANDRSMVLRATAGRHRLLLAADSEESTERRLVALEGGGGGRGLRATILAVGHHGSKTSTSAGFLAAVSPRLATVGVGARNAYGHPHPAVVARLADAGVRVHRTDTMGALHLLLRPGEAPRAGGDLQ